METPTLTHIKKIAEGDEDFQSSLILILKRELPKEFSSYKDLIKEKAFSKASEIVHKMRHKIIILGLEEGHKIASQLENELKKGLLTQHHNSFTKIIATMEQFLEKIN